jgi:hypothetical protein
MTSHFQIFKPIGLAGPAKTGVSSAWEPKR